MRPRFHVPALDATSARVELPDEEAEHLVRVLRLGAGDEVEVLDGRGGLWRAEIVHATKKSAAVRPIEALQPARELAVAVTLVVAVLKGDKTDDVVRDAVMLGVSAIRPVISERTESSLAIIARAHRIERWQRIAVASAKQCGRAVVPLVHEGMALDRYWQAADVEQRIVCVEPSAAAGHVRSAAGIPRPASADVIVGPEGGWTAAEVKTAREFGAMLMSLGARTLRADAVPMVALTALLTTWGELT